MFRRFLFLGTIVTLGACAYAIDDSVQELTVLTPGAKDALCFVSIDDLRYKFRPPQTQWVSKSRKNMTVDCLAPGNRRKKIEIESDIEKTTFGNVATGVVPGAAWDYASGAMFRYPDTVEVNFVNTPVRGEDMPAQNNPDIRQPEDYLLEEFRPASPRMNSDRYEEAPVIRKREAGAKSSTITTNVSDSIQSDAATPVMDKGELMNVIQDLGVDVVDPSGDKSGGAAPPAQDSGVYGPPVPLFPGQ